MFDFQFEPVPFEPPRCTRLALASGTRVLVLAEHELPLCHVHLFFDRGYASLPSELYIAGQALDEMVRTGGSQARSSTAIDDELELRATQLSVETESRGVSAWVGSLTRNLGADLALATELLSRPAFEERALKLWKGKQIEAIRRRNDRPGPIASRYYDQVMYGDHPIGRFPTMAEVESLTVDDLKAAHALLFHPGRLTVGVSGAVEAEEVSAQLEALLSSWRPRGEPPPPPPPLEVRAHGGVFFIQRSVVQSSIYVGQPGGVKTGPTRDYFASRVLNFILGGSGFTSRLTQEVRTRRGYAYSARTSWDANVDDRGALTAITETRSERTLATLQVIREVFAGLKAAPPTPEELHVAQENIRHSFLFEYEQAAGVVAQQVHWLARGLPEDWFEIYLEGIAAVTRDDLAELGARILQPDQLTAVVVGDAERFDGELSSWGEVTTLPLGE